MKDTMKKITMDTRADRMNETVDEAMKKDLQELTCENRDWGTGIPAYTGMDELLHEEVQVLCARFAVKMLGLKGYRVIMVMDDAAPARVLALQDGECYDFIVAGEVSPGEGSIPYLMKNSFSALCQRWNRIPRFLSVSMESTDGERVKAGLALRGDSFRFRVNGAEDLTDYRLPKPHEPGYRAYCLEVVLKAYCDNSFSAFYGMLADNAEWHSHWVPFPRVGKEVLIEYFDKKAIYVTEGGTECRGEPVIIAEGMKQIKGYVEIEDHPEANDNPNNRFFLFTPPGTLGGAMLQRKAGATENDGIFITLEFNDADEITVISLSDPEFFNYKPLYTFHI